MIITMANAKGGVGKSTSAIFLGCALLAHGSVQVLDLDRQGTALEWAERCHEDGTPLPMPVSGANPESLERFRPSTDFTIIDTPPGNPDRIDAGLGLADLVIVPTAPGGIDMSRVWATLRVTSSHAPSYVLFTGVDRRSRDLRDAMEALRLEGAGYFENDIPLRRAVRNALGTVPDRMFNYDRVAAEILEIA